MGSFRERVAQRRRVARRKACIVLLAGFFGIVLAVFAVMRLPAMQRAWLIRTASSSNRMPRSIKSTAHSLQR